MTTTNSLDTIDLDSTESDTEIDYDSDILPDNNDILTTNCFICIFLYIKFINY